MLVYYDETGRVLHTMAPLVEGFVPPPGDYVEADDVPEDTHNLRVVDGKVVRCAELAAVSDAEVAKAEALAYLAATDWYVTRQMETGKAIPEDVVARRAAARDV